MTYIIYVYLSSSLLSPPFCIFGSTRNVKVLSIGLIVCINPDVEICKKCIKLKFKGVYLRVFENIPFCFKRLGNHLFINEDQLIVFTFVTVFPWLKGKEILIISIKSSCVNLTSGILNILANLKQNEWWSEMYLIIPARTMSFQVLFQCCIMHAHVEQRSGRLQDALQFS